MRLPSFRLSILVLSAGLLPLGLLAQDNPPEQVELGPFDAQGSVTVGYRFTDIGGRREKFTELFDLRRGPRVLDFNLMGKTAPGTDIFADSFSVSASGLGGEPFSGGQLDMRKEKLYDLRINYRQSYYYWDRNDSVIPPSPTGIAGVGPMQGLTTNHNWATVRRFGSANLAIHATDNLRFLFEYGRNSRRGVNFTTRTMDYFGNEEPWGAFERANPYYVDAPMNDSLWRTTGGISYSPRNWNFHYRLGYQKFWQATDWFNPTSPERSINTSAGATANELLDFARWSQTRELKTPVSEFSFNGHPHERLDIRGGYIFYRYKGPAAMRSVFQGDARTNSGGTAFAPYTITYDSQAELSEPNHVVDSGFSLKIKDWWNLHTDYRYSRFVVDSAATFHSLRDYTTESEGEVNNQWKLGMHLLDMNMEFLPTHGLIIRSGIRYLKRDIEVLEDGEVDDVRTKRIKTVWPTLSVFYQPVKRFSVRGDFQSITSGASYTRISPHTDVGSRFVFRYKLTDKISIEDNLVLRNRKFLETDFRNNLHLNAFNIAYDMNERFGVYGGFSYDSWFATASVEFIRGTPPPQQTCTTLNPCVVTWRDQTVNRVWTAGFTLKPYRRLGIDFSGNYVRTTGAGEITGEPPYFGPMTWPLATGSVYYDFPRVGRFAIDLQRTYYLEEIIRGNDFQASLLTIRWTRDF
ncbi:MAG: hypothetical protein ACE145_08375 [Terriglobia bacterium]